MSVFKWVRLLCVSYFVSYSIITEFITFFLYKTGRQSLGLAAVVGGRNKSTFYNTHIFFGYWLRWPENSFFFLYSKISVIKWFRSFLWQSNILLYSFVCKSKTVYCIRPGVWHSVLLQLVGGEISQHIKKLLFFGYWLRWPENSICFF